MITASIVLYKNKLEECHSILDCLQAEPVDRIFLVDHSGDDRLSELESCSPRIEYIPHENLGYGAGHNVAIRKAMELDSTYHLVVNADILFKPGTIPVLAEYMDGHPDVGHMMPKVFYPNGDLQYLCKLLPSPWNMIARGFLPESLYRKSQERFTLAFTNYERKMNVPYLSGCFMFLRMSVLREVGMFDQRFFMYPEDNDLTRRIHAKYKTLFFPEVSIVHNHAAESHRNWKMKKIHMVNQIRYFNKWGWFFDAERRRVNYETLKETGYFS